MYTKSNPFTPWPPSQEDLLWLAGLLDGEGTFYSCCGQPRIECTMSDKDTILRAAGIMGAGSGRAATSSAGTEMHRVWATTTRAGVIMKALRPHMSKRRQGQIDRALGLGPVFEGEF